jgi:hypothetical protein
MAMTASTTIDADIYQCAAFDLCRMSRNALKEHYKSGGLERSLTKINEHDYVYAFARNYASGFQPRDLVMRVVWKWLNESTLVIASESFVDQENYPTRDGFVRASTTVLAKLKRLDPIGAVPQTHMTYTQQVNLGGGECEGEGQREPLPPPPPPPLSLQRSQSATSREAP